LHWQTGVEARSHIFESWEGRNAIAQSQKCLVEVGAAQEEAAEGTYEFAAFVAQFG